MGIYASPQGITCDTHGLIVDSLAMGAVNPQAVEAAVFEHKLIMHPRVHAREMREVGIGLT